MVGFDIGCHEAIITVINIRDLNYIHIEFVKSYNGFMTANVKSNHLTV